MPPLSIAQPFGDATEFGFAVPQGDPDSIQQAAVAVRRIGDALADQARALQAAAQVALDTDGDWHGSAASAYAKHSDELTSVQSKNAGVCEDAARTLSQLSDALAHAQYVTRVAQNDCETYSAQHSKALDDLQNATAAYRTAIQNAHNATHAGSKAAFEQQAAQAHSDRVAAQRAATTAETNLTAAKQAGSQAYEAYAQEASTLGRQLETAAGEIQPVHGVYNAAPVPISVTPADLKLAKKMLASTTLAGAARAMKDHKLLERLSHGRVNPGVALAFTQLFAERAEGVRLHKAEGGGLQGGVWDVTPGGRQIQQFGQQFYADAHGTVMWTLNVIAHPGEDARWLWQKSVLSTDTNTKTYLASTVSGRNSLTGDVKFAEGLISYGDWAHGRYGAATANVAFGVVLWKGPGAIAEAYRAAPGATVYAGARVLDLTGVSGIGSAASQLAELLHPDSVFRLKTAALHFAKDPIAAIKRAVAPKLVVLALRLSPADLHSLSEPPVEPKIVVVQRTPDGRYQLHGR